MASRHRYISIPCHWPYLSYLRVANTICCYHPSICLCNFNMPYLDVMKELVWLRQNGFKANIIRAKGTKIFSHKWKQLQIKVCRNLKFTLFNQNNYRIPYFCIIRDGKIVPFLLQRRHLRYIYNPKKLYASYKNILRWQYKWYWHRLRCADKWQGMCTYFFGIWKFVLNSHTYATM